MPSRHDDWFRQAAADLRHARSARAEAAHDWACFAAHQAAAKALKAALMRCGADAWGHTVTGLLGAVSGDEEPPADLVDCAKALDKHAIPARYPSAFPEGAPIDFYTGRDSDEAITFAERLMAVTRGVDMLSREAEPADR